DASVRGRDREIRRRLDALRGRGAGACDGHGVRSGARRSTLRVVGAYRRRHQPDVMEFDDALPVGAAGTGAVAAAARGRSVGRVLPEQLGTPDCGRRGREPDPGGEPPADPGVHLPASIVSTAATTRYFLMSEYG